MMFRMDRTSMKAALPLSALLLVVAALSLAAIGNVWASAKSIGRKADPGPLVVSEYRIAPDLREVALLSAPAQDPVTLAQQPANDPLIRDLEKRGFSQVASIARRGENHVFEAVDPAGAKVRVVMNTKTGEIVGLTRIMPPKK